MQQQLRMDSHAYAVAVSGTRLTPRAQEIARAVLVDGEPQHQVAQRAQVTPQRVSRIVRTVVRKALQLGPCPMCGRQ